MITVPAGDNIKARFTRSRGFWPIRVVVTEKAGDVLYILDDVRICTAEVAGKQLYLPAHFTQHNSPDSPDKSDSSYNVDEASIKWNPKIDPAIFQLQPWPNESVGDMETKVITPAADAKWIPDGRVGFPFQPLFSAMSKAGVPLTATPLRPTTSPLAAGLADGSGTSRSSAARDERKSVWMWTTVLVIGVLFVGFGVVQTIRRRNHAAR